MFARLRICFFFYYYCNGFISAAAVYIIYIYTHIILYIKKKERAMFRNYTYIARCTSGGSNRWSASEFDKKHNVYIYIYIVEYIRLR